jgi:hypothetical protein
MKTTASLYTFNKTAKTVTFTGNIPSGLEKILAIINVTSNTIIYNPTNSATGGTYASPVLTLTYDTSAMNDADKLLIYVEVGDTTIVTAGTADALSNFRSLTANSTAQAIKSSAGNIYGWNIINNHSNTLYVKLYNIAAGSVNPASDVPVATWVIPGSGSVYVEADSIKHSFTTAISVRAVTNSTDTVTTAPVNTPTIEIQYK